MRTIPSYAPKKNAVQRKAKRVEEVVPDALWECVLCSVKANMTPLKRRGPDGKRVISALLTPRIFAMHAMFECECGKNGQNEERPVL
jgi:hypothetical protein